ncbi:hypothetical protein P3W45_000229 [Vairimorpha bombi]
MEVERTYKNGNIISLSLTNFQTFKSSVINFSPSLNFIIGPNGSGKSTISNAISLIFGGTPKTIGKTKNIKEYIKFGEHDCKIEAEIFYEGQNIKIGRGFSIANNFWYINGSVVKKNIYEAFIDKLNINVNNLCQYLPQEKVSEFCRMSSEELLINTLLSLNKDSIVETLTYLNEIEHKLNDTSARESCLKKQKEELESMVEKINKDVVKMEERDYKVKRIDMLESKRTWVEYDDVVKDYKRLENSIKVLERNFGNNEKEVQDIVKQIENIENNPQNIVLQNKILELDEWDGKLESIKDEIRSLNNEKGLLDIDLEYLNKKREKRAEKLNHLKTELESSKEELDRVKEGILEKKDLIRADDDEGSVKRSKTEELTYISHVRNIDTLFQKYDTQPINEQEDEIFKLKRQAQIIQQKCIDVKKVVDELEDKKKKISEAEERRLEQLKKYSYESYRGILWLRENKEKFQDEIIEPPFLSVSINDTKYTNEIEAFLSFHALTSFICKNSEDFEKFSRILKDEMKLGVNIVEAIRTPASSSYTSDQIRKFGFDGVVIDFIDVRKEIKDFLISSCHLNDIPISKTNLNEKYIFENTSFRRMAVDNKYVEIRRSKYNKKDFTISSLAIKPKNIFSSKLDTSEIENKLIECNNLRNKYKDDLNEIYEVRDKIEFKLKKMYEHKKDYDNQVTSTKRLIGLYKVLIENIRCKSTELKECEESKDIETEENKINAKKNLINSKLGSVNGRISAVLKDEKYLDKFKECVLLYKDIKSEFNKLQLLYNSKNNIERQNMIVRASIDEHEKIKDGLKPRIRDLKELLKDKLYTKEEMSSLPDSIDELTAEIRTEKTQLKFINIDEKIKDVINGEFLTLFSMLGCEGKIEFEYENLLCKQWKMNILVKFRDIEKLEKLSSFRQSGGEKSVSTILFLLALQKIDSAPFRLVDEINQGMDKYNEKLILDMLFDICQKDKNTQFFIISPKLVEGLSYNKTMNIIVLFSDQCSEVRKAFLG